MLYDTFLYKFCQSWEFDLGQSWNVILFGTVGVCTFFPYGMGVQN
jgi:hypothetical protein